MNRINLKDYPRWFDHFGKHFGYRGWNAGSREFEKYMQENYSLIVQVDPDAMLWHVKMDPGNLTAFLLKWA